MTEGRAAPIQIQDLYERIEALTKKCDDLAARYEKSILALMREADRSERLQHVVDRVSHITSTWPTQDWYLEMLETGSHDYRIGVADALSVVSQLLSDDLSKPKSIEAMVQGEEVDPRRTERDRLICAELGLGLEQVGSMFLMKNQGYVVWQHLHGDLPPRAIQHSVEPYSITWYRVETYYPGQWERIVAHDLSYQETQFWGQ